MSGPARRALGASTLALIGLVLAVGPASGQAAPGAPPPIGPPVRQPPSQAELLEKMTADLSRRLELSESQLAELRPILEEYLAELTAIRGALREQKLTPVEALVRMRDEGEKSADRVVPLLTSEQVAEYEQLRARERSSLAKEIESQGGQP